MKCNCKWGISASCSGDGHFYKFPVINGVKYEILWKYEILCEFHSMSFSKIEKITEEEYLSGIIISQ
jgi:hypothetical protein